MKDSKTGPHAIQVYQPQLNGIAGWQSLDTKKQGELYEISQHIHQRQQISMLGEFGNLMDLNRAEELLEGEEMTIDDFVHQIYPERHQRTIDRKREIFRQIAGHIPPDFLKKMTKLDSDVLSRFERIANAALGDVRNAVLELPASIEKNPEKYLEELDTKLLEHRQQRRQAKPLHQDEGLAAKMATNAVLHYLRACGLKASAQKRKFLTRVMGWVMQAEAVSGTLRAGRIPIPDGIIVSRGRPRMTEEEKRKAREAREAEKRREVA